MQTIGNNTSANKENFGTNVSLVQGFLDFISNPNTSIPINSNFAVQFEIPTLVAAGAGNINNFAEWEPLSKDWQSLDKKRQYLIETHNQNFFGNNACLFANGIRLPQEKLSVERGSFTNGGILAGVYGTNRTQQEVITTTFLETETSFIDLVLKPWVMLTSHMGLIARGSRTTPKTNLTVFVYSKQPRKNANDSVKVKIRKTYTFYDCAPVGISGDYAKHDFGANSGLPIASVDWVYNYYTISTNEDVQVQRN